MRLNNFLKGIVVVLMFGMSVNAYSQGANNFKINEAMTENLTNYVDDYGSRHAWVELFNTSYGTSNLAGCYLTNDPNNLTKYRIPKGDVLTAIQKRQHVVFWLDNAPDKGTFHVNFTFDPTKENYIALVDGNGRDIIDEMRIPVINADSSYGLIEDGGLQAGKLPKVTPSSNNVIMNQVSAADKFREQDPRGFGLAIVAMSVVFCSLLVLFLAFKYIGQTAINMGHKNSQSVKKEEVPSTIKKEGVPGEVFAAIVMAMHEMQDDAHDIENTVLTINRVTRAYSPWSSKLYGLLQNPRR